MEHHSKLKLSSSKCSRVHIGKQINPCPDLKVHEDQMKTSNKEKYLESFITTEGNLDATIENQVQKVWSYYAEIKAIINDFPFGKRKTEIGLMLREAMFVNGILYNIKFLLLTVNFCFFYFHHTQKLHLNCCTSRQE